MFFVLFCLLKYNLGMCTSFISNMKVDELVSKSSSTPILVKIWSATRKQAYSAGTNEPEIKIQWRINTQKWTGLHLKFTLGGGGYNFLLTYLSHDLTQRHLFEVSGFATHVGSCYDDKVAALRDVAIVRYRLLSANSLQNCVTALFDGQRVCKLWTHWRTEQKNTKQ